MTTSNSPNLWRRRRSSKVTDTEPRMARALDGNAIEHQRKIAALNPHLTLETLHAAPKPEPEGVSELAEMLAAMGCTVTELGGERLCVTAGSTTYSVDTTSQAVKLIEKITAERAAT